MAWHGDLGARGDLRRAGIIGLLLLLGVVGGLLVAGSALPASAEAAKCLDCEGEEPGEEPEAQILTIEVQGPGSVATATKTVCENVSTAGSKTCEVEVAEGKKVTLSATPAAGFTFTGWSGACAGTGTCEVTMTSAKSVTATFADVSPPAAPTITSPTHEQVIESTTGGAANVAFNGSGDPTAVSYLCRVDLNSSSGASGCSPPAWNTGNLATGTHTVYVWAKDAQGNISGASSRSFKVVNLPETTLGGTPTEGATATSGHTAFTFSSATGTSYRCTLNGTEIACAEDLNLAAEGAYTFTVAAGISPFGDSVVYYDPTPETRTWTVDFPAPVSGGALPGSGSTGAIPNPTAISHMPFPKLISKWRLEGSKTVFRKLMLKRVLANAKVIVTCGGASCPFKRKQPKVRGGVADLTPFFSDHELDPGTKIRLKVTAPGMSALKIGFETRSGKAPKGLPAKFS